MLVCNPSYMERLNKRITRLRIEKGLTRRALAEACHVSHVAVGKWESGDTENIKLANVLSLAETFGITASELLAEPAPKQEKAGPPVRLSAAEQPMFYGTDDEQELLRAYRAADPSTKQLLLAQAKTILEQKTNTRAA